MEVGELKMRFFILLMMILSSFSAFADAATDQLNLIKQQMLKARPDMCVSRFGFKYNYQLPQQGPPVQINGFLSPGPLLPDQNPPSYVVSFEVKSLVVDGAPVVWTYQVQTSSLSQDQIADTFRDTECQTKLDMWKANAAQADKEDLQWAKEHPNGAASVSVAQ
jgi:hypothetical protein